MLRFERLNFHFTDKKNTLKSHIECIQQTRNHILQHSIFSSIAEPVFLYSPTTCQYISACFCIVQQHIGTSRHFFKSVRFPCLGALTLVNHIFTNQILLRQHCSNTSENHVTQILSVLQLDDLTTAIKSCYNPVLFAVFTVLL